VQAYFEISAGTGHRHAARVHPSKGIANLLVLLQIGIYRSAYRAFRAGEVGKTQVQEPGHRDDFRAGCQDYALFFAGKAPLGVPAATSLFSNDTLNVFVDVVRINAHVEYLNKTRSPAFQSPGHGSCVKNYPHTCL